MNNARLRQIYIDKIVPNNYEYVYFKNKWKINKNKEIILTLIANFYSESCF